MPRLDTILSFGTHQDDEDTTNQDDHMVLEQDAAAGAAYDSGDEDQSFEFAFAPPLSPGQGNSSMDALADDIFSHGRILPAYPVFDRPLLPAATSSTAPPSPDTFCAWAPRSAPASPTRAFPKSASTGTAASSSRRWRLRDLVAGAAPRSHSDGKEKFLFLQPHSPKSPSAAKKHAPAHGDKKKAAAPAAEMDMATAHRLFYGAKASSPGGMAGGERRQQGSYLPYRPVVGFFASARAFGRSNNHPY